MLTAITLLFVFLTLWVAFMNWIDDGSRTYRDQVAASIIGALWALMGAAGFYHTFL